MKLSVVLATRNEQENISRCLESVKNITDEIVVVDEFSTDNTVQIAKKYGAKVFFEPHHDNFHITKQKALDLAEGEWILQLDADEVVSVDLAIEIDKIINSPQEQINKRKTIHLTNGKLFARHQKLLENRDGRVGKEDGDIVAFYIPRLNTFLGHPMLYGGVYPDGVVRLVKKGFAHFPQKSVHEQIKVDGLVGWLSGNLEHYDSPTLKRYLNRLNRYTDLNVHEFNEKEIQKNVLYLLLFTVYRPLITFFNIYFRHKGFLDGPAGFLWAFFSASHFPIAYFKYFVSKDKIT